MEIKTTRFGQVEIKEEDIILFSEGLIGFPKVRKFVLLDDPNDELFIWLQSCEDSHLAFPVLEPELFAENYNVSLTKSELEALEMTSMESSRNRSFTIVTIPADVSLMTANLKAPIVVNVEKKIARQCVLQDNKLAIKEPIFTKLQQRMLTNSEQPIKRVSTVDENFTVMLPQEEIIRGRDLD